MILPWRSSLAFHTSHFAGSNVLAQGGFLSRLTHITATCFPNRSLVFSTKNVIALPSRLLASVQMMDHLILSFLPRYEWLELIDCCNGLVLCKYGSSTSSPSISHFVVCNPATRQWMELRETRQEPDGYHYITKLAFNPSWSLHFYIFNFEEKCTPGERMTGTSKVAIFSSRNKTWFMDDSWEPENQINVACRPHFLLDGKLFLQISKDRVLVIDAFHSTELPSHWIVELPGYKPTSPMNDCLTGCLGQSSGVLHYAQPDADGRSILVWSQDEDGHPHSTDWNLKHRFSMSDAFGQDFFLRQEFDGFWSCDYDIECLDLERELIFFRHFLAGKLLSCSLSTGELTEIQKGVRQYLYYVLHCAMFPTQDETKKGGHGESNSEL